MTLSGCGETNDVITASNTILALTNYTNNMDCASVIRYPVGRLIKVSFLFLDIEKHKNCG